MKDIVETRNSYRKILKLAVKRFLDALTEVDENGDPVMKVNTIAEFEKIVKLDLLYDGERPNPRPLPSQSPVPE